MNDQLKLRTGAGAGLAPKQASVAYMIENDLEDILDKANVMNNNLKDLEIFLFGDRNKEPQSCEDAAAPQSWEERIKFKLNRITSIQQSQLETFENISKFYL